MEREKERETGSYQDNVLQYSDTVKDFHVIGKLTDTPPGPTSHFGLSEVQTQEVPTS